ncbi:putative RNA-dependent RNA polymerase [Rhizoctonia solani ourmia-like virus 3]|uniref:RNA-dependent RNA polymerase n=1 Tax=Rhizoctonia solani ourmia-like virus 3 TaxID=2599429 RepID=A0ABX5Y3T4_9VIRU|nr:putative RNA-dependent RNA polymerase [Rhizoctonia solani ourmia-like virus 3]QDW65428.1 putative RNA-dependent RNA polymerase [Rhizoctonia solani ourmia-like virus 3]
MPTRGWWTTIDGQAVHVTRGSRSRFWMFVRRKAKLRAAWQAWRDECAAPVVTAEVVNAENSEGEPTEETVASATTVAVRESQLPAPCVNLDGLDVRRVASSVVLSFLDSAFPPSSKGNDVFDTPLEVDEGLPRYEIDDPLPPSPPGQYWASSAQDVPILEAPVKRISAALPAEIFENILAFCDDETLLVLARMSRGLLHLALKQSPHLFGSPSFGRMLLRLVCRAPPSPPRAEPNDGFIRLESLLHSRPLPLADPLRPCQFRVMSARLSELRDESSRTGEDNTAAIGELLDSLFGIYLQAIGIGSGEAFHYDKKAADVALRGAIGSVGSHGDHVFRYPGLPALRMDRDIEAARAFGIYMARKTFFNPSPNDLESATAAFLDRVTSPPPPSPDPSRTEAMLECLRRFTRLHLVPDASYVPPVPCSGKSCLERSRKLGGKRAALFEGDEPILDHVRPQTIFSGGKPRTICIHSYMSEECSFLNSLMLDKIRPARWLVTGRTVAQWVSLNEDRWTAASEWAEEPYEFASGDLRAATDNFSGAFAEAVLSILYERTSKWHGLSLDYILSNITRARFLLPPPPDDPEAEPTYAPQKRGQLLSSDASFPILCLIGVLIAMETLGVIDDIMALPDAEFVTAFMEFDAAGVNGDDVVIYGPAGTAERWTQAVLLTGGVPEPTKSPCDREFFTINSQLWRRPPSGRCYEIESVKPAMLVALSSAAAKAPHESWVSLLSSPLLTAEATSLLGLDTLLFPELPVSWGGLGYSDLASGMSDELLLRRALFCRESRGLTWIDATPADVTRLQAPYYRPGQSRSSFGITLSAPVDSRPVSGLLPLSVVKSVRQAQFSDPGIVHWTALGGSRATLSEIRYRVQAHLVADRRRLMRRIRREFDYHSDIERDRLVYVEGFELPDNFEDPYPHPPPPSSIMRHKTRDFDPGDRTTIASELLYWTARRRPQQGSRLRMTHHYRRWASAHEEEVKISIKNRGYSLAKRLSTWSGARLT